MSLYSPSMTRRVSPLTLYSVRTHPCDEVRDERGPQEERVLHHVPLVGQQGAHLGTASQRVGHILEGRHRVGYEG